MEKLALILIFLLAPLLAKAQADSSTLLAASSLYSIDRLGQDHTLVTNQAALDRLCKRIDLPMPSVNWANYIVGVARHYRFCNASCGTSHNTCHRNACSWDHALYLIHKE